MSFIYSVIDGNSCRKEILGLQVIFSYVSSATEETSKGAVYTAFVAPSRPKNESVTDRRTNQPTDGHTLIQSRFVATKKPNSEYISGQIC